MEIIQNRYPTNINYPQVKLNNPKKIIFGVHNISWDTGSSQTIFFNDSVCKNKWKLGITYMNDWLGNSLQYNLYFSKKLQIDTLHINNLVFHTISHDKIIDKTIGGLVGMNVISCANWLLNFSNNTLLALPQSTTYLPDNKPVLALSYIEKIRPVSSISIEGISIIDMLIDTGSDADIQLSARSIELLNKYTLPIDTLYWEYTSMAFDTLKTKKYVYKNLTINNVKFDTTEIVLTTKQQVIGAKFFRKFNKVFLDTQKQEFQFY